MIFATCANFEIRLTGTVEMSWSIHSENVSAHHLHFRLSLLGAGCRISVTARSRANPKKTDCQPPESSK